MAARARRTAAAAAAAAAAATVLLVLAALASVGGAAAGAAAPDACAVLRAQWAAAGAAPQPDAWGTAWSAAAFGDAAWIDAACAAASAASLDYDSGAVALPAAVADALPPLPAFLPPDAPCAGNPHAASTVAVRRQARIALDSENRVTDVEITLSATLTVCVRPPTLAADTHVALSATATATHAAPVLFAARSAADVAPRWTGALDTPGLAPAGGSSTPTALAVLDADAFDGAAPLLLLGALDVTASTPAGADAALLDALDATLDVNVRAPPLVVQPASLAAAASLRGAFCDAAALRAAGALQRVVSGTLWAPATGAHPEAGASVAYDTLAGSAGTLFVYGASCSADAGAALLQQRIGNALDVLARAALASAAPYVAADGAQRDATLAQISAALFVDAAHANVGVLSLAAATQARFAHALGSDLGARLTLRAASPAPPVAWPLSVLTSDPRAAVSMAGTVPLSARAHLFGSLAPAAPAPLTPSLFSAARGDLVSGSHGPGGVFVRDALLVDTAAAAAELCALRAAWLALATQPAQRAVLAAAFDGGACNATVAAYVAQSVGAPTVLGLWQWLSRAAAVPQDGGAGGVPDVHARLAPDASSLHITVSVRHAAPVGMGDAHDAQAAATIAAANAQLAALAHAIDAALQGDVQVAVPTIGAASQLAHSRQTVMFEAGARVTFAYGDADDTALVATLDASSVYGSGAVLTQLVATFDASASPVSDARFVLDASTGRSMLYGTTSSSYCELLGICLSAILGPTLGYDAQSGALFDDRTTVSTELALNAVVDAIAQLSLVPWMSQPLQPLNLTAGGVSALRTWPEALGNASTALQVLGGQSVGFASAARAMAAAIEITLTDASAAEAQPAVAGAAALLARITPVPGAGAGAPRFYVQSAAYRAVDIVLSEALTTFSTVRTSAVPLRVMLSSAIELELDASGAGSAVLLSTPTASAAGTVRDVTLPALWRMQSMYSLPGALLDVDVALPARAALSLRAPFMPTLGMDASGGPTPLAAPLVLTVSAPMLNASDSPTMGGGGIDVSFDSPNPNVALASSGAVRAAVASMLSQFAPSVYSGALNVPVPPLATPLGDAVSWAGVTDRWVSWLDGAGALAAAQAAAGAPPANGVLLRPLVSVGFCASALPASATLLVGINQRDQLVCPVASIDRSSLFAAVADIASALNACGAGTDVAVAAQANDNGDEALAAAAATDDAALARARRLMAQARSSPFRPSYSDAPTLSDARNLVRERMARRAASASSRAAGLRAVDGVSGPDCGLVTFNARRPGAVWSLQLNSSSGALLNASAYAATTGAAFGSWHDLERLLASLFDAAPTPLELLQVGADDVVGLVPDELRAVYPATFGAAVVPLDARVTTALHDASTAAADQRGISAMSGGVRMRFNQADSAVQVASDVRLNTRIGAVFGVPTRANLSLSTDLGRYQLAPDQVVLRAPYNTLKLRVQYESRSLASDGVTIAVAQTEFVQVLTLPDGALMSDALVSVLPTLLPADVRAMFSARVVQTSASTSGGAPQTEVVMQVARARIEPPPAGTLEAWLLPLAFGVANATLPGVNVAAQMADTARLVCVDTQLSANVTFAAVVHSVDTVVGVANAVGSSGTGSGALGLAASLAPAPSASTTAHAFASVQALLSATTDAGALLALMPTHVTGASSLRVEQLALDVANPPGTLDALELSVGVDQWLHQAADLVALIVQSEAEWLARFDALDDDVRRAFEGLASLNSTSPCAWIAQLNRVVTALLSDPAMTAALPLARRAISDLAHYAFVQQLIEVEQRACADGADNWGLALVCQALEDMFGLDVCAAAHVTDHSFDVRLTFSLYSLHVADQFYWGIGSGTYQGEPIPPLIGADGSLVFNVSVDLDVGLHGEFSFGGSGGDASLSLAADSAIVLDVGFATRGELDAHLGPLSAQLGTFSAYLGTPASVTLSVGLTTVADAARTVAAAAALERASTPRFGGALLALPRTSALRVPSRRHPALPYAWPSGVDEATARAIHAGITVAGSAGFSGSLYAFGTPLCGIEFSVPSLAEFLQDPSSYTLNTPSCSGGVEELEDKIVAALLQNSIVQFLLDPSRFLNELRAEFDSLENGLFGPYGSVIDALVLPLLDRVVADYLTRELSGIIGPDATRELSAAIMDMIADLLEHKNVNPLDIGLHIEQAVLDFLTMELCRVLPLYNNVCPPPPSASSDVKSWPFVLGRKIQVPVTQLHCDLGPHGPLEFASHCTIVLTLEWKLTVTLNFEAQRGVYLTFPSSPVLLADFDTQIEQSCALAGRLVFLAADLVVDATQSFINGSLTVDYQPSNDAARWLAASALSASGAARSVPHARLAVDAALAGSCAASDDEVTCLAAQRKLASLAAQRRVPPARAVRRTAPPALASGAPADPRALAYAGTWLPDVSVAARLLGVAELGYASSIKELVLNTQGTSLNALPHLKATLLAEWAWDLQHMHTTPFYFHLGDVQLCIGTMLVHMINEVSDRIDHYLDPIKPVLKVLNTQIPLTRYILGRQLDVLELAQVVYESFCSGDCVFEGVFEAVGYLDEFFTFVGEIAALGNDLDLDGCNVAAVWRAFRIDWENAELHPIYDPMTPEQAAAFGDSLTLQFAPGIPADQQAAAQNAFNSVMGWSGGFAVSFPFLANPIESLLEILLGQGDQVALVQFTVPTFTIAVGAHWDFPIWWVVSIEVGFSASFVGNIGPLVYTAAGIDDIWITHDAGSLLNGLGVEALRADGSTIDVFQASFSLYGGVAVNIFIFSAHADVGLTLSLQAHLLNVNHERYISFDKIIWMWKTYGAKTMQLDIQLTGFFDFEVQACIHLWFVHHCWTVLHWHPTFPIASWSDSPNGPKSVASSSGALDMSAVGGYSLGDGDAANGPAIFVVYASYDSGAAVRQNALFGVGPGYVAGTAPQVRPVGPSFPVTLVNGPAPGPVSLRVASVTSSVQFDGAASGAQLLTLDASSYPAATGIALDQSSATPLGVGAAGVSIASCAELDVTPMLALVPLAVDGLPCTMTRVATLPSTAVTLDGASAAATYASRTLVLDGDVMSLTSGVEVTQLALGMSSLTGDNGALNVQFGGAVPSIDAACAPHAACTMQVDAVPAERVASFTGSADNDVAVVLSLATIHGALSLDGAGGTDRIDLSLRTDDSELTNGAAAHLVASSGYALLRETNTSLTMRNFEQLYFNMASTESGSHSSFVYINANPVMQGVFVGVSMSAVAGATTETRVTGCGQQDEVRVLVTGGGTHDVYIGANGVVSTLECAVRIIGTNEAGQVVRVHVDAYNEPQPLRYTIGEGHAYVVGGSQSQQFALLFFISVDHVTWRYSNQSASYVTVTGGTLGTEQHLSYVGDPTLPNQLTVCATTDAVVVSGWAGTLRRINSPECGVPSPSMSAAERGAGYNSDNAVAPLSGMLAIVDQPLDDLQLSRTSPAYRAGAGGADPSAVSAPVQLVLGGGTAVPAKMSPQAYAGTDRCLSVADAQGNVQPLARNTTAFTCSLLAPVFDGVCPACPLALWMRSQPASALNVSLQCGAGDDVVAWHNAPARLTLALDEGDNVATLDGAQSDVSVTSGAGADSVQSVGARGALTSFTLGDGDNSAVVTDSPAASSTLVLCGAGVDTVRIQRVGGVVVDVAGGASNNVLVQSAAAGVTVRAADGDDTVTVATAGGDARLDVGEGANRLNVSAVTGSLAATAGSGNDVALVADVSGTASLAIGDGANSATVARIGSDLNVSTASGADVVNVVSVGGSALFLLGDGDNTLSAQSVRGASLIAALGSGVDGVVLAGVAGTVLVTLGESDNSLDASDVGGALTATAGAGHDTVTLARVGGDVDLTLGAGANSLVAGVVGGSLTATAGDAVDTVQVLNVTGSCSLSIGAGANTADVRQIGGDLTVLTGDDDDLLNVLAVTGSASATLAGGANRANIAGVLGNLAVLTGAGDDELVVLGVHGATNASLGDGTNLADLRALGGALALSTGAGVDTARVLSVGGFATIALGDGVNTLDAHSCIGGGDVQTGVDADQVSLWDAAGASFTVALGDGLNQFVSWRSAAASMRVSAGSDADDLSSWLATGAVTLDAGDGANHVVMWGSAGDAFVTTGNDRDAVQFGAQSSGFRGSVSTGGGADRAMVCAPLGAVEVSVNEAGVDDHTLDILTVFKAGFEPTAIGDFIGPLGAAATDGVLLGAFDRDALYVRDGEPDDLWLTWPSCVDCFTTAAAASRAGDACSPRAALAAADAASRRALIAGCIAARDAASEEAPASSAPTVAAPGAAPSSVTIINATRAEAQYLFDMDTNGTYRIVFAAEGCRIVMNGIGSTTTAGASDARNFTVTVAPIDILVPFQVNIVAAAGTEGAAELLVQSASAPGAVFDVTAAPAVSGSPTAIDQLSVASVVVRVQSVPHLLVTARGSNAVSLAVKAPHADLVVNAPAAGSVVSLAQLANHVLVAHALVNVPLTVFNSSYAVFAVGATATAVVDTAPIAAAANVSLLRGGCVQPFNPAAPSSMAPLSAWFARAATGLYAVPASLLAPPLACPVRCARLGALELRAALVTATDLDASRTVNTLHVVGGTATVLDMGAPTSLAVVGSQVSSTVPLTYSVRVDAGYALDMRGPLGASAILLGMYSAPTAPAGPAAPTAVTPISIACNVAPVRGTWSWPGSSAVTLCAPATGGAAASLRVMLATGRSDPTSTPAPASTAWFVDSAGAAPRRAVALSLSPGRVAALVAADGTSTTVAWVDTDVDMSTTVHLVDGNVDVLPDASLAAGETPAAQLVLDVQAGAALNLSLPTASSAVRYASADLLYDPAHHAFTPLVAPDAVALDDDCIEPLRQCSPDFWIDLAVRGDEPCQSRTDHAACIAQALLTLQYYGRPTLCDLSAAPTTVAPVDATTFATLVVSPSGSPPLPEYSSAGDHRVDMGVMALYFVAAVVLLPLGYALFGVVAEFAWSMLIVAAMLVRLLPADVLASPARLTARLLLESAYYGAAGARAGWVCCDPSDATGGGCVGNQSSDWLFVGVVLLAIALTAVSVFLTRAQLRAPRADADDATAEAAGAGAKTSPRRRRAEAIVVGLSRYLAALCVFVALPALAVRAERGVVDSPALVAFAPAVAALTFLATTWLRPLRAPLSRKRAGCAGRIAQRAEQLAGAIARRCCVGGCRIRRRRGRTASPSAGDDDTLRLTGSAGDSSAAGAGAATPIADAAATDGVAGGLALARSRPRGLAGRLFWSPRADKLAFGLGLHSTLWLLLAVSATVLLSSWTPPVAGSRRAEASFWAYVVVVALLQAALVLLLTLEPWLNSAAIRGSSTSGVFSAPTSRRRARLFLAGTSLLVIALALTAYVVPALFAMHKPLLALGSTGDLSVLLVLLLWVVAPAPLLWLGATVARFFVQCCCGLQSGTGARTSLDAGEIGDADL